MDVTTYIAEVLPGKFRGKTPSNTVSRCLRQLRGRGLVEKHPHWRGYWRLREQAPRRAIPASRAEPPAPAPTGPIAEEFEEVKTEDGDEEAANMKYLVKCIDDAPGDAVLKIEPTPVPAHGPNNQAAALAPAPPPLDVSLTFTSPQGGSPYQTISPVANLGDNTTSPAGAYNYGGWPARL